mmetsp:Transcript_9183/g.10609  ORF Transcript_9183/g.10609 Transcript_9183/m.10609 type:complete len:393 (+) Transcript_9183:111-1289(+)
MLNKPFLTTAAFTTYSLFTTLLGYNVQGLGFRDTHPEISSNLRSKTRDIANDVLLKSDAFVDIGDDDDSSRPNGGDDDSRGPEDKSKSTWSELKRTLIADLTIFPGYDAEVNEIPVGPNGQVTLSFDPEGSFKFRYRLMGLNQCTNCKVAIHLGTTCDVFSAIGQSLWNSDSLRIDPWDSHNSPAMYNASYAEQRRERSSTGDFDMNIGYGFDEVKGRVVIFSDSSGNGVSCGVLESGLSTMVKKEVILAAQMVPGTRQESRQNGVGEVGLFYKLDGSFILKYNVRNLPDNCRDCKVQVMLGTMCDETNLNGSCYWNSNKVLSDPWAERGNSAVYTTPLAGKTTGEFEFFNGFEQLETRGHAVVFRDERNDAVACGTLDFTLAHLMKDVFDN